MGPQIIHVVLLRWAATAAPDAVEQLDAAARTVRESVPGVVEISHGPSVSTEHLERGYDYGLYVRFTDAAARDAYLPHPAHRPLADLITTHADTVLVFDLAGPPTAPDAGMPEVVGR
ncbi:Dabb family protein [Actinotalea solisilvae]|uniref:Dabb family protein n=1 Tax=Actinotalea solisilvae TaxID=2072922 RepID=UPI0018F1A1D4|nr:Dabb family protein [Actinotalea solisilvae]